MPQAYRMIGVSARLLGITLLLLCGGGFFSRLAFSSGRTPAEPQAAVDTVRRLPLAANDLVYDPVTQLIYASVPGRAGAGGNSLTPVNPALSTVGAPVFVGSEPDRMAISDDGRFIYVGLDGASAIRRFDVAAQTPDLQFSLGINSFGLFKATDIAVMPGNPNTVAVSMESEVPGGTGKVAVYDDGVQRPEVLHNYNDGHRLDTPNPHSTQASYIQFSNSPATIYGAGHAHLERIAVTPAGLAISHRDLLTTTGDTKFDGHLLYLPLGRVVDPESGSVVGTFNLNLRGAESLPPLVLPDPAADRVYFIVRRNGSYELQVFEKGSFQPVDTLVISPSSVPQSGSLIRWGAHGLAFCAGDEVITVQTPLVPSSEPLPPPPPSPTPTPMPTPVPTPGPGELRVIPLAANDLVLDPRTQTLYASVSSSAGADGDSITAIDPAAGAVGAPVFVGSEPNRMAISDDGRFIYVGLDGASAIRRYDVDTHVAGLQFGINISGVPLSLKARDIAVMPGHPGSVAVVRSIESDNGSAHLLTIYNDGVESVNVTGSDASEGADVIEFSTNPAVVYGFNDLVFNHSFKRLVLAPCGFGARAPKRLATERNVTIDFKLDNGRIYTTSGEIIAPDAELRLGRFARPEGGYLDSPVAPDSKGGRAYYVTRSSATGLLTLHAYDLQTFLEVGRLDLPGVTGTPKNLVRWGANGLAFSTVNNQGAADKVVIIQTALVAPPTSMPEPAPTPTIPGFSINGSVSLNGFASSTRLGGVTLTLSGSQSATVTTDDEGNYSFDNLAPCGDYTVTPPSLPAKSLGPGVTQFTSFDQAFTRQGLSQSTVANFSGTVWQFTIFKGPEEPLRANTDTVVSESDHLFSIEVQRLDTQSGVATIDYATKDGTASSHTDYTPAVGTLRFPGGSSLTSVTGTFPILIIDDPLAESPETFTLAFSNPTGHRPPPDCSFTLTINSDDAADGPNPVRDTSFDARFFVRQHYLDFLGREPDATGLAFWIDQTTGCGSTDPLVCRVNVSAAFFQSIEFQETGYLIYKTYGAAYGTRRVGNAVPLTLREFLSDTREISRGIIVNFVDWRAQLKFNQQIFFEEFVSRPSFVAQYPATLSAGEFVEALNANTGGALTADERDNLAKRLRLGLISRGQVLHEVAENGAFSAREFDRGFVLMQYFGYLRRNPDDAPDNNFAGYDFWLNKLNQHGGDFTGAEMIKAFISSDEYRHRFGP